MMRILCLAFALALTGSAAMAERYNCKMNGRDNGFIPQLFAIDVRGDGTAFVIDNFVAALEETPKKVATKLNRKGEVEVRWQLDMPTSEGRKRVRFRATLNEQAKTVSMAATLRHASNHERGTGTCQAGHFPKG